MAYRMLNAEDQAAFEDLPEIDKKQPSNNETPEEKMRRQLQERMKLDDAGELDRLNMLMLLLKEDENPDDDIYNGKGGKLQLGDGFINVENLFENGDNDSLDNINAALELSITTKAYFGNQAVIANLDGYTEEQLAMQAYAAQLTGENVVNLPDPDTLSDEIKQKMDAQWAEMQKELGIESPAAKVENKVTEPEPTPENGPAVAPNAPAM